MSVSHPFLKQLKVYILSFCESPDPITDAHPSLLPFCRTLEDILLSGLKPLKSRTLTSNNNNGYNYFNWMSFLLKRQTTPQLTYRLHNCLQYASECKKTVTAGGRGRLAIRLCLKRGVLGLLFRVFRVDKQLLSDSYYEDSILFDDILSQIFLSLIAPLDSQVKFELDSGNASFLDETWELPWFRRFEMVPSPVLGVELFNAGGRLVVVHVEQGSLAEEHMRIECGDIIDGLFNESLRRGAIRKAVSLMEDYQGSPLYVSVIKCLGKDDQIFRSIHPYLEESGLCKQALIATRQRKLQEALEDVEGIDATKINNVLSLCQNLSFDERERTDSGLFRAYLCGYTHVGSIGTVDQIEQGVLAVLKTEEPKREVLVELGETHVTVFSVNCDTVLLQHGYPEIASCGRRVDQPLNFSYIAGETSCTLSRKFHCFVFEGASQQQATDILKGIAEGFHRTHWTREGIEFMMDEVLPNLFIGGFAATKIPSLLRKHNIENCVSISEQGRTEYSADSVVLFKQWKRVCVADNTRQDISHLFHPFIVFIHTCRLRGEGVLVHCQAGVSRSPTIVIAYLMTYMQMTYEQAYVYLKSCRHIIQPNSGFTTQLKHYEQIDLLERRCDLVDIMDKELEASDALFIRNRPPRSTLLP